MTELASGLPSNLLRVVARNALSQTGGRILLTVIRFGVAIIVVRGAGLETFGQYALVLSFVLVAEWLADFGQTDIAVRDIAADGSRRKVTLGALAVGKLLHGFLAALLTCVAVAALGYPEAVVRATLIAGAAIVLYAFVLVYRADFRASMRMEKDVGAEILSALALAAAVWYVTESGATLESLTLCYLLSRAVYLVAAGVFAGALPRIGFRPEVRREVRALFIRALPLGFAGLLVSVYDAMDAVALARWSTAAEVGIFSVAARILLMAVIVVQALSLAVFPVMSAQWANDREAFARTAQASLNSAVVLGGAVFSATWCGAGGLAAFFKHDPIAITAIVQLLSWAILARVVVTILSPMVVVSGRQLHTLWLTGLIVTAKWLALLWLVPAAGAAGAALAYLVTEIAVGFVPTVVLCQRLTGIRLAWGVPARALGAAAAVAGLASWIGIEATLLQGAMGLATFLALGLATGAINGDEVRQVARAMVLARRPGSVGP